MVDPKRPPAHSPLHPDVVSPVVFPNRPTGQAVHAAAMGLELNWPRGHRPEHADVDSATVAPYRPGPQPLQEEAPLGLHCPVPHWVTVGVLAPALGQMYPAVQFVHTSAPAVLYVPGGHTLLLGAAVVEPWEHANPALHGLHVVAPTAAKLPGGHTADGGFLLDDPVGHAYPASQGPSHEALVAPGEEAYRPALQLLHALAAWPLNVPGGHKVVLVEEPLGQVKPWAQAPLQNG